MSRLGYNDACQRYFSAVSAGVFVKNACAIVVTHMVPDRRNFLPALSSIIEVDHIISIPYSCDPEILCEVKRDFEVCEPSIDLLQSEDFCRACIQRVRATNVIILDIGGYFSNVLQGQIDIPTGRILGIVEDTENGHARYSKLAELSIPVVSVARSPLKVGEDIATGSAVLFSLERALRERGQIFQPTACLVIGFGKVGRGIALALRSHGARVFVFDTDPIRRIEALGWGFAIPDRRSALSMSDMIFGATGRCCLDIEDVMNLPNGALLVSASSKDIEFPVHEIRRTLELSSVMPPFEEFITPNGCVYLVAGGTPINFRDRGVVGPLLTLTQAEILISIQQIASESLTAGLQTITAEDRARIAILWIDSFLRPDGVAL